eukprot:TRINITY_DN16118_c0_g2_i1.p1 TRINITY_DN16118_c0_g2~~TRINITY_DN16118_c0_g2_i1.p1  ORF type:complete len:2005 (-),score=466.60 TRINITY_DN16118_c0_g2_i1:46-6060(-)
MEEAAGVHEASSGDEAVSSEDSESEDSPCEDDVESEHSEPWWQGHLEKQPVASAPTSPIRTRGFWARNKEAAARKLAVDCAKSGYVFKLRSLLREHGARALLLSSEDGQVGPQLTLLAAAQASGSAAIVEAVEEAATALLFEEIRMLSCGLGQDLISACLRAGADPTRPYEAGGLLPLQEVCTLRWSSVGAPSEEACNKVAKAAAELVEAAPLALILVSPPQTLDVGPDGGQAGEGVLPLAAAAANIDFGTKLIPVLCSAVGRLLLRRPALAAAPLLQRSSEVALTKCPEDPAAKQLASILQAALPVLQPASQASKKEIWEASSAYESWRIRQRRLCILEPLLAEIGAADGRCEEAEAVARLSEVEALMERRRREHAEQVSELQLALDRAQRAMEEATARAAAAVRATSSSSNTKEAGRSNSSGTSQSDRGVPSSADSAARLENDVGKQSAGELLCSIRQQRGLDVDYSSVPPAVAESAAALQRSIGAAVERLAVDLYASRGHFLLELIQNADDNRYREGEAAKLSLSLGRADDDSLFFAAVNNELGMSAKDVEAICDINRSTKPSQEGKIGKKGVGWKAVFAVSDRPTILSGNFRFCFDVRRRGRLGYVTPDDLDAADLAALPAALHDASAADPPATVLFLPLRGSAPAEDGGILASGDVEDGGASAASLVRSSVERLLACPAWLLFLRQLRHVFWEDTTVVERLSSSSRQSIWSWISAERQGDSLRVHRRAVSAGTSQQDEIEDLAYVVHRKSAVVPPELLPPGVAQGSRQEEVAVAFLRSPLAGTEAADARTKNAEAAEPVFCFLPVRPVGFRFLLHAPWALTSNREDFHLEDPRNTWLRGVAAEALAEAITKSGCESGSGALALLDGRRVLEPFWRRLLEEAVLALGDAPVVPVEGEDVLYRPSQVLVAPPQLVRCRSALRFLRGVPPEFWLAATGKRLARLAASAQASEEALEEDAKRLISLHAEALSAARLRTLLNLPEMAPLLCAQMSSMQPTERPRSSLLSPLLEVLGMLLTAAAHPGHADASRTSGEERLAQVVAEIQQMKVLPLSFSQHDQQPVLTCLAEGDVFLPGTACAWCPGLDQATSSLLLAHKGVRVLQSSTWQSLPPSGQGLLRRLGLREATLAEVAAAVVRIHGLCLNEAVKAEGLRGTFVRSCSGDDGEVDKDLQVLWAGLEAVRLAREGCLISPTASREPQAETGLLKGPDPALCGAPTFRPDQQGQKLTAEALGLVLWLPSRAASGHVLLRRAPALVLPSFLGVTAGGPQPRQAWLQEDDLLDSDEGTAVVALPASSASHGQAPWSGLKRSLLWEVFLADLGCAQPDFLGIDSASLAERIVSGLFWEALANSAELRRHACRIFREQQSWLPELEVPQTPLGFGPQRHDRICHFFRRAAFEPILGEGALPYVDAQGSCEPLLDLLRIPSHVDFENLCLALKRWVKKEPPPMCAPKALMAALQDRVVAELSRPTSLLTELRDLIFIPGKGTVSAQEALWSIDDTDADFTRKLCTLVECPLLKDIYGDNLQTFFCDYLNVRSSPGALHLLRALERLLPAKAGGSKAVANQKIGLAFLRQVYAKLLEKLQEGATRSRAIDGESSQKRLRVHETDDAGSESQGIGDLVQAMALKQQFQCRRLIILPQPRGRPWKFLNSVNAYWSVHDDLADLPCSKFALNAFYGDEAGAGTELRTFFVEVLGVTEELTREELMLRFRRGASRASQQGAEAMQLNQRRGAASDSSEGEDDEEESADRDDDIDDGMLGVKDMLGDDADMLGLPTASTGSSRSMGASNGEQDVEDNALKSLMARCTQRTKSAQAGDAFYTGAEGARRSTGSEEVAMKRVSWSHSVVSLYACGPPAFLGSQEALQAVGISVVGKQVPGGPKRGSLSASGGLQARASAFAAAVLLPLARLFQVPTGSLALAVGPGIGRGKNMDGLICFALPDSFQGNRQPDQRELCRWFCELCRLLAENMSGEGFTSAELASALTAKHLPHFLELQASTKRRRT